jgi:hypothetical protein
LNNKDGVSKTVNNNIGNAIPALMEETETIPVIRKTIRNTPKQVSVRYGCKASRTPNIVATPFPPLKPAKTGNM